MRHGQSQNNILSELGDEICKKYRVADPELTQLGVNECRMVGQRLSEMGIQLDMMLTSAMKRAILSLKYVREGYQNAANTPCGILTQIHEIRGITLDGQNGPGLKRSEVLDLIPEFQISEEQGQILTEEGWFNLDHVETNEEILARAKLCIQMFKDMAKSEEYRGKTVFAVSHGFFIHVLIVNLLCLVGDKKLLESYSLCPHNNALTIIDFDVEEAQHFRTNEVVTAV